MFRFPGRQSGSSNRRSSSSRQTQRITEIDEESVPVTTSQKKKKKDGTTAELPTKLRRVRACMICSLIKTESEFEEDGCDNCEAFLHLKGTKGAVLSYTSANFEGMIAMIQPEESWVARWQRIATLKAGAYAINVRGEVDQWVKDELIHADMPYVCRDKTQISESKREKIMHMRKKHRRRKRKPSLESNVSNDNDDAHPVNDSREVSNEEQEEQTEEPENLGEPEKENNEREETIPVNLPIIKEEPIDAPSDTASFVGNMPYRSGRRFSSSSSSSEESDAEPCSKGSYSP